MGRLDKNSYKGCKYHFRYYRPSGNHPFLVVLVNEIDELNGKAFLSGFNLTHSKFMVEKKPNSYLKIKNPNPSDNSDCYLQKNIFKNKPLKLFSSPIKNWKLSLEDGKIIDELVKKYL